MSTPACPSVSPAARPGLGSTALGLAASAACASAGVVTYTASPLPLLTDGTSYYGPPGMVVNPFDNTAKPPDDFLDVANNELIFGVASGGKPPVVFSNGSQFSDGGEPETLYYRFNFTSTVVNLGDKPIPVVPLLGVCTLVDASLFPAPGSEFASPGALFSEDWYNPGGTSQGFIGFSFQNSSSDPLLYGWLEFAYDDPSQTLALLRIAYDDTGASLYTADSLTPYTAPTPVPEPATTALAAALVAGSAALYLRRRKAAA